MLLDNGVVVDQSEPVLKNENGAFRVLLIEDNSLDAELITRTLMQHGQNLSVDRVETLADALLAVECAEYQAVLSDLELPDSSGISTVKQLLACSPQVPVIVVTGHEDEKTAVEALKFGAQDYLYKGHEGVSSTIRSVRYAMERKRFCDQLVHMAHYDQLTGLANRSLFNERLKQSIERARRAGTKTGLLFIDVDQFKQINDAFGHEVGDELLKHVAERLLQFSRSTDVAARLSGDEFAVILESVHSDREAHLVAQRVVETFTQPFEIVGRDISCSVSVGVALVPDNASNAKELVRSADAAMYQVKRSGRNGVAMFDYSSYRSMQARMHLLEELRLAVEKKQFVIHFQPQIDLRTGQIWGLEALVRWQHPERGLVFPMEFIPLLEEEGRIVELGGWIIREVCRYQSMWRAEGLRDVRVAVNVSPKQLLSAEFMPHLKSAFLDYGVSAGELELEITEHLFAEETSLIRSRLTELRSQGVSVAIDDFGTGYSSLGYLRDFPIDVLKVDQSFVQRLCYQVRDAEIARAVISLGDILGLEVVAEGVEEESQLKFLKEAGCAVAQGFFFSEAKPEDAVYEWLLPGKKLWVDN
ncbi:MAG: EAL domain-containing protein [Myxococcales bacterium]|nr:MAG: EAL domain-containing protein [Myxococcales bacterium]